MPCTVASAIVIGIEQTSVPGFSRFSVPPPCSTISQQNSWPNTTSRDGSIGQRPPARRERSMNCSVNFAACRSVPQMPQHSVFTSTWPAAGRGSAMVSTTKSPRRKIAARMPFPPVASGGEHSADICQMLAAPEQLAIDDKTGHAEHAAFLCRPADHRDLVAQHWRLTDELGRVGAGFCKHVADDHGVLDIQLALPKPFEDAVVVAAQHRIA